VTVPLPPQEGQGKNKKSFYRCALVQKVCREWGLFSNNESALYTPLMELLCFCVWRSGWMAVFSGDSEEFAGLT